MGAFHHLFLRPGTDRLRILPEHALPGTGRVYKHSVKKCGKAVQKSFRSLVCHNAVPDPEQLQVMLQCARTGSGNLICDKHAAARKPCAKLRCLPARSGTKIKYPVFRMHRKNLCRRHRARLLQVVYSGTVPWMLSGIFPVIYIITVLRPRDLLQFKGRDRLKQLRRYLQPVQSEAISPSLIKRSQKSIKFLSQEGSHLLKKHLRQVHNDRLQDSGTWPHS